jgi:hypothetical protein
MVKIIISLLITLFIVYIRIWLINSVFVNRKIKIDLTWKIFLTGFFIVWSLFVYKYLLDYVWLENIYFAESFGLKSLIIFIIYCILFVVINSLVYKNISRKNIWQSILLWLVLFLWIWYGWYVAWITTVLMYYFLAAYAEEIMKFIAWENVFLKEWKDNSDLIFFCILVGLAFAIVENIFYLGSNIFNQEINLIWLSLGRWLVSSMLHVITTWIVAYVAMKWLDKKTKVWYVWQQPGFLLFIFIGIILWFGIHSIYNLGLFYNRKFITIPLIVLGYFVFSFLMFKSDKIYLRNISS